MERCLQLVDVTDKRDYSETDPKFIQFIKRTDVKFSLASSRMSD